MAIRTTTSTLESFIEDVWLPELRHRTGHKFKMALSGSTWSVWCECEAPVSWEEELGDPALVISRYTARALVTDSFLDQPVIRAHLSD